MSTTRDAFERHSLSHGWKQPHLRRNPDDTYMNPQVQEQWTLWQAASAPQPAPTVPADIALPLKAQRNWECYMDPADADPDELAQPFVRIVDANGATVTTAHDLFEFRPGHAEFLVAAANALAPQAGSFAWAAFAENGNVIIWSRNRSVVEPVAAEYGRPVVPVIALTTQQPEGTPVPAESFERASPVQQRKALDLAHLFVKVGIGFVPMPVHNAAEFDRLADQCINRIDDLQKAAELQEGGAA